MTGDALVSEPDPNPDFAAPPPRLSLGRLSPDLIVLYVDLDGVVQHEYVIWNKRLGIHMSPKVQPRTLFEWSHHLEDVLTHFPQVRLVLSSSWCRWPGYGKTLKFLPSSLRARFIGGTYHRRIHGADPGLKASFEAMSRGAQVCADVLRRRPAHWLAIDDDTENWPEWARPRLIACDGNTGLSNIEVQEELRNKLQWCVQEIEKEARWRRELDDSSNRS